ncbi:phosphotransferase [Mycoplasma todarodis]|uniref:phosphotransferase n=1 Tax=Mycoplasma todarodis TaxID=1937191 RepID=UPI003B50A5FF
MKLKDKVKELLIDKTNIKAEDINEIVDLKGGSSSNENYLVKLNNGTKYQVKMPDRRMIQSKNNYAYKKYEPTMIKFIGEDGTLIKEWIEGAQPDFANKSDCIKVLNEIKQFHKIKPQENTEFEFGLYAYRDTTNISKNLLEEFDELSKFLEGFPKGFIHGDINPGNILVNEEKAYLIDLEWSMNGWLVLDYAYLIAFSNIDPMMVSEFSKYNLTDLQKIVRLVYIHTLMWCENEETEKANILFKEIINKLA